MNITENDMHERIKNREAELEHCKINSYWSGCLIITGQIRELQSLALDCASQQAVENDREKTG